MLEADGLRVVFFKQGDRYAHRVEWFDDVHGAWTVAVESLEGTPDDPWPPSPPFQQLHVEERPTGRVILLVGMAGRTHWSAAVEVAADCKAITFDIATRVQVRPQRLGSAYHREGKTLAEAPHDIVLRSTSTAKRQPLQIMPDVEAIVPGTIAWKYEISHDTRWIMS